MPTKNKGAEHRHQILENAAGMMYSRGYLNTSLRDLAALSSDNVAIFNYYFGSKYRLALDMYAEKVNPVAEAIRELLSLDEVGVFILFNLTELRLALTEDAFARFYHEFSAEAQYINTMQNNFIAFLLQHFSSYDTTGAVLAAMNIVPLKPAIITYRLDRSVYDMNVDTDIPPETFLRFYLHQLLETFFGSAENEEHYLSLFQSLSFRVEDGFRITVSRCE